MSQFSKNLAALQSASQQTARQVSATQLPDGFSQTVGSDGTPTFCRSTHSAEGAGRLEWLGGTSMPQASAAAIVASLDAFSSGANGLGLSIGSGFEWVAFERRLGRAQMLYVYEPDPALLRMALDICDMAELLARRRIVLLTGSAVEAGDELAALLRKHIGLPPPTVLHPLASLAGERRHVFLAAGEAIVRRTVTERQALDQKLYVELGVSLAARPRAGGCVAFRLTPRHARERPLEQEVQRRGLRQLMIDAHDTTGTPLRLHTLIDAARDGVPTILSDLFRPQMAPLPAEVLVETWVPPLVGAAYWERLPPAGALGAHDRLVVHAGYQAERLKAHGIAAGRIEVRPLLPRADADAPVTPALALRHRVALVADLPATDADALGINLPTHQAVFAAAGELIKADYLVVHPGMAGDLLRRAITRTGLDPKADDPALRAPMLRIIRDVLIPALPPLVLAGALAAEGMSLLLVGDWPGIHRHIGPGALGDPSRVRRVPLSDMRADDWGDVALLAHLSPEGAVSPLLWDAVAAGVVLVAPRHVSDRFAGSIAELLVPDRGFSQATAQNLVATIKALLRDGARREKLAAGALQRAKELSGGAA